MLAVTQNLLGEVWPSLPKVWQGPDRVLYPVAFDQARVGDHHRAQRWNSLQPLGHGLRVVEHGDPGGVDATSRQQGAEAFADGDDMAGETRGETFEEAGDAHDRMVRAGSKPGHGHFRKEIV